jgi:hypothetical protein
MTRRKATLRSAVIIAVAVVLVTGVAARGQHLTASPTATQKVRSPEAQPLYGQLANGDWVMVHRDQMFFVGAGGVRSLCPDGDYRLKNGSRLPVLAAHIVPPWVKQGFNPQPEPPGKELRVVTAGGRPLVISGGRLFFAGDGGLRTRCPDGVYALAGGGSVRIIGGRIQDAARLQGFAP